MDKRSAELFREQQQHVFRSTDHIFGWLMLFQWVAGIVTSVVISSRTWIGESSQIHVHVWASIFLGGIISLYPAFLAFYRPGRTETRYVISCGQVLMSALLIHLSGGRIETHFHVFGSLAFISFYRDWKVLIPATVIVALDHWVRGVFWPQTVYGVLTASPWRWLEHAGWVVFEDIILIASCVRGTAEMKRIAENTAQLENNNQIIENKVRERTDELSRANQIILQSEKMSAVGQLAAGVAHEINNPLGVILGFSQSVVKRLPPGNEFEMPLKSIEREAFRCRDLVQNLLSFSRAGKAEMEEVDAKVLVESALTLVLAQARVKDVEVVKELAPNLPPILANRNQFQQVVVNLCNNALDAMPERGVLTIRTSLDSLEGRQAVRLDVQDTGVGIPKEIQSRVFEPFFTTKEIGKGTGLGLSLVYEIVQKHQGRISLESEVGRGTKFSAVFPVNPAP